MNLENILNDEQFAKLLNAINNKESFSYEKDGLKVDAKSTDNSICVNMTYTEESEASKMLKACELERNKFVEFIDSIDDDIWVEALEYMGNPNIQQIQDALNLETDLEKIRSAIFKFKSLYKEFLKGKISEHEKRIAFYKTFMKSL